MNMNNEYIKLKESILSASFDLTQATLHKNEEGIIKSKNKLDDLIYKAIVNIKNEKHKDYLKSITRDNTDEIKD